MKAYWQNLTSREQGIVFVGSLISALLLFYWLLFLPVITKINQWQQLYIEKTQTAAWIEQARQQLESKQTKVLTKAQLLGVVAHQLEHHNLNDSGKQLKQITSGDVQLSFQTVNYLNFTQWLWKLTDTYRITISELTIERTTTPGIVKVNAVLAVDK